MLFIPNNYNELCGAMDKPSDFEFWDRGSMPTRCDSFVLYSILSFFKKLVLYVSIDNNINCDKCVFNISL